ncbi:MAG TPA: S1/P1 nuclease [Gemmataceae bacterium]|nr:S1/P1 nuclease [Gemmataceae bacterium]
MLRSFVGLAVSVVLLAPGPGRAWNSIGHQAVSKLAYDQLTEAEQLKIFNILKAHPHYQALLAAGRPNGVSEPEWVIMRSSVWPDWVRPRRKESRGPPVTKYNRPEEHYITHPVIAPGDEEFFTGKVLVNPDFANIVTALKTRCNEIRTKSAVDEDRAVAICWVFHLIGDIHQPLHNASYFSRDPAFVGGDLGGNKLAVRDGARRWKLHAYWDDLLGVDRDYNDDTADHQVKLYRAALQVAERIRGLTLSAEDKEQLAKNTSFDSWSKEGFELAKAVAYAKGDGTGFLPVVEAPYDGAIPDTAPELGDAYTKRALTTAEKRAVIAGKRLADRMKVLLK